jgi:hypothetical protein
MRRKGRFLVLAALAGGIMAPHAMIARQADESTVRVAEGEAQTVATSREVKVILYLIDLIEIKGAEQSFRADILLRAEWHDPELAGVYEEPETVGLSEVWQPQLQVVNQLSLSRGLPETVEVLPDGTVRYIQRLTGELSARMNLRDFPLDSQEFSVLVVAVTNPGEETVLLPDPEVVSLSSDELSITDWRIGAVQLEPSILQAGPLARELRGATLTIEATRVVRYYVIQVLIPLVAIVLMGWTVFWIAPSVIPTRVGVVVTTMLTLFAYRFMVADHVPRLSYLTRFDYFILGATVIVMLGLLTMAGTAYLWGRGQEAAVKRIDRAGRLLYPLAFAVYSAFVWLG